LPENELESITKDGEQCKFGKHRDQADYCPSNKFPRPLPWQVKKRT
jgi:hypothetical protein